MGVKGLSKLIKQFARTENSLEFMANSIVAIDTSIFLYRYKYGTSNTEMFLRRFLKQIRTFQRFGVTPIYVFDGIPPEEKKVTLEKRNLTREKGKVNAELEPDLEKAKNIEKNIICITKQDTNNLVKFLELLGVKYILPGYTEGEKYCAYLNKNGYADYAMSNDYDTIVFGCTKLVTTVNDSCYNVYNTKEILENLDISKEHLVDLCIASGSDYFPQGIPRMGPKKSLDYLKKYGNIEKWDNISVPENLNVQNIRNIFCTDPCEEDTILDTCLSNEGTKFQCNEKDIKLFFKEIDMTNV